MTALASPVVTDAYLREAIADEATLARLLGWTQVEVPSVITESSVMWGRDPDFVPAWPGASCRGMVPKWRRNFSAFELIGRCGMTIVATDTAASVLCAGASIWMPLYSEHPSRDDAIRFAVCKAAIEHFSSQNSSKRGP